MLIPASVSVNIFVLYPGKKTSLQTHYTRSIFVSVLYFLIWVHPNKAILLISYWDMSNRYLQ